MTWLFLTLADNRLALRFPYDADTVATLRREFGGEDGTARFDWDAKQWLLPKSQFPALCAVFGDRLSVAPDVWSVAYPCRKRAARKAVAA